MNEDAKAFFDANPDEPYWYYSPTLRVPNGKLKPWQYVPPMPWPAVGIGTSAKETPCGTG